MKNRIILGIIALSLFLPGMILGQKKGLEGAYHRQEGNQHALILITEHIFSYTVFDTKNQDLLEARGGNYTFDKKSLTMEWEWNSKDSSQVGKKESLEISLSKKGELTWNNQKFDAVLEPEPGALKGEWIISGNYQQDKVQKRANPWFPRRTMKILSNGHFQWIAYNVKTGQFFGTGGGLYEAKENKYAETIKFFTKAKTSIGKTMRYSYEIKDGDWRHKGEKSTGGPLDECWSPRSQYAK